MTRNRLCITGFAAMALLVAPLAPVGPALAQAAGGAPAAPAATSDTPPDTPPDMPPDPVVTMRAHWLDADINAFTFRNSEQMFETRRVAHGPHVSPLPAGVPLAMPRYTIGGVERDYDSFARRTYTNALLVIRDGHIRFEAYRNNSDAGTRFISFSMAKSITATLVGLALADGHIASLDDPAGRYVPELAGGGYADVSIRHLLQMRSGVAYEERYDFGANPSMAALIHQNAIVLNRERFADRARTIGRAAPAGSRFNYATLDTAVLGWVLERATGRPVADYMRDRLWQPAGMESDGLWIADGPPGTGRELTGMGFSATLRDFGRLGLLWLNDGVADGQRVLPAGWVAQATAMLPFGEASGESFGRGYGYQYWQVDNRPGAYAAVGLAGQFIYVDPATRTVIVKLSHFPTPEPPGVAEESVTYFHAIIDALDRADAAR